MSDWIILGTSGRNTLPLVESLARDGFNVWAPAEVKQYRAPRSKEMIERRNPLMPYFVFARSEHLHDMLNLAEDPRLKHGSFSVYHPPLVPGIPFVSDCSLDPLREEERALLLKYQDDVRRAEEEARRKERRIFNRGDIVTTRHAGFEGMTGIVEEMKGKYAMVMFDKRVKIAGFLLDPRVEAAA